MEQKTTLSQSIDTTEEKAQYDEACKKLLAEKIILAWIMKHTIKEYADYEVREIVERFIVGDPKVAAVPVLPDETNAPKIAGTGVEDGSLTEGTITYDIQFHAIVPGSNEVVQMIINVEAQNDFYPGYPIIKRGIYYCARMISSQYGTVFTQSHYEKIRKVYSIWICVNPPKWRNNTITQYVLREENLFGNVREKQEYYDLINAVMICLGTEDDKTEHKLLRLLDVLLSSDRKATEKKEILESEFHIPMTENMEKEVNYMCNLSDGVENKGIQKGIKIGIQQGIEKGIEQGIKENQRTMVMNMLKENEPIDKICRYAECNKDFVKEVQAESKTENMEKQ